MTSRIHLSCSLSQTAKPIPQISSFYSAGFFVLFLMLHRRVEVRINNVICACDMLKNMTGAQRSDKKSWYILVLYDVSELRHTASD